MAILWIDETLPSEEREKQKQMKADMKVALHGIQSSLETALRDLPQARPCRESHRGGARDDRDEEQQLLLHVQGRRDHDLRLPLL